MKASDHDTTAERGTLVVPGPVIERRVLVIGLMTPVLAACATKTPAPGPPSRRVQRGLASWYGHGYQGKRTASGERFDKHRLTAAHDDLPFGTRVCVRNVRNDHQVDLRINDRIPVETVKKGRFWTSPTLRRNDCAWSQTVSCRSRSPSRRGRRASSPRGGSECPHRSRFFGGVGGGGAVGTTPSPPPPGG